MMNKDLKRLKRLCETACCFYPEHGYDGQEYRVVRCKKQPIDYKELSKVRTHNIAIIDSKIYFENNESGCWEIEFDSREEVVSWWNDNITTKELST